jgi:hypothetical protein
MKKLLLIAAVSMLSGCALVDAYLMTKYDPNEYRIISEIRSDAKQYKAECSNPILSAPNAIAIANKTQLFEVYSQHIPRNDNGYNSAKNLNEIAQGLAAKYKDDSKVSPMFCKLKFQSIENSAEVIQHVLGGRPR